MEMPRGVQQEPSGTYRARIWDSEERKRIHLGCFPTPQEAAYARLLALQSHHWEGMPQNYKNSFGFTYLITNLRNGRMYIGKKQFYRWIGPRGGFKCTDPTSPLFDPDAWEENDWQFYTGSSDELNEDIQRYGIHNFRYRVLSLSRNKLDLHIAEVNYQLARDVLNARTEDAKQYLFYNKNIASMEFRPPYFPEDAEKARAADLVEMRNYYLKPDVCGKCLRVLPFRNTGCDCTGGVKGDARDDCEFEDLR